MRNRFPGNCDKCLKPVGVGYGVVVRIKGRIFARCDVCQHSVTEAELLEQALIPFDDDDKFANLEPVDSAFDPQRRLDFDRR